MKIPRLLMLGTMAAVISLASHAVVVGQQSLQPLTVALSDPGRPGTLEVNVVSGGATTLESRIAREITPIAKQ